MKPDNAAARWQRQSPMTDPGAQAKHLHDLPSDISALCETVGNLLIHCEWLPSYGLSETDVATLSRATLPAAARLAHIRALDVRPLLIPRDPAKRSPGTCRDYAVLLCALLRAQGIAARVRCGFAAYFNPGRWEDHWVCERWLEQEQRWALADAQLDSVLREELKIAFDHTDMPKAAFITAGEAWLNCRSGTLDPAAFGHGETTGLWFMHVNVARDHLALNDVEASAWDTWREAGPDERLVPEDWLLHMDAIATQPEAVPSDRLQPAWRRS
jgi:hypothetical protein